jgi:hypothetical protein
VGGRSPLSAPPENPSPLLSLELCGQISGGMDAACYNKFGGQKIMPYPLFYTLFMVSNHLTSIFYYLQELYNPFLLCSLL